MAQGGWTLLEAARLAAVSKSSMQRAVKSGRVSATRDDAGNWRIDPAELTRVWPAAAAVMTRGDAPAVTRDDATGDAVSDAPAASGDAMRRGGDAPVQLDIEVEALKARLADAHTQIEWLRGQVETANTEKAAVLALLEPPARETWYSPFLKWWNR
ncbi:MAG: hypothetical protein KDF64_03995 [Geminicoccaceae bacterium]|nr:hypothetical protein [Geminicoccaceae bacterium]